MLGAITGDIIGSIYERHNVKNTRFELFKFGSSFTDDTVLTIAVADALLQKSGFATTLKMWGLKYPNAGYGQSFYKWLHSASLEPYNSWGNGSAMRVSPVGFAYNSLSEVLDEAKRSAEITHNHPEGIKGARATAAAIFLARTGNSKDEIKRYLQEQFQYDLDRRTDEIRPGYSFDVSCQGSVPEAIISFLESTNYENAIRLAISLGGDSDTIACIAGGIAEAYYGYIPQELIQKTEEILPDEMLEVLEKFRSRYMLI